MESFCEIFNRFVRLLPFLAGPFCYRRFHYEWFYPYPDVWNRPDQAPAMFAARNAAPSPRKEALSEAGAGRARLPPHPVGHYARPYLRSIDMNSANDHRGEPFW